MEGTEEVFTVEVEDEGAVGVQIDKNGEEQGGSETKISKKWYKGMPTPNPKGRPTRQFEKDVLDSLRRALPPEKLEFWIERALELANSQQSARGIIAVLSFAYEYSIGRPVQQMSVDTGKTELLEQLLRNDGEPLLPDPASMNETHTC